MNTASLAPWAFSPPGPIADGVDAGLAVEAAVGRACPGDEILRLFPVTVADAFLNRLNEWGILLGDIRRDEVAAFGSTINV